MRLVSGPQPVDAAEEAARIDREIERQRAAIEHMEARLAEMKRERAATAERADTFWEQRRAQLEAEAASLMAEADRIDRELAVAEPVGEIVDTQALVDEINEAHRINALIRDRNRRRDLERQAADYERRAAEHTRAMVEIDRQWREAIMRAQMPSADRMATPATNARSEELPSVDDLAAEMPGLYSAERRHQLARWVLASWRSGLPTDPIGRLAWLMTPFPGATADPADPMLWCALDLEEGLVESLPGFRTL